MSFEPQAFTGFSEQWNLSTILVTNTVSGVSTLFSYKGYIYTYSGVVTLSQTLIAETTLTVFTHADQEADFEGDVLISLAGGAVVHLCLDAKR